MIGIQQRTKDYHQFLKTTRKKNGEKLLPSTIERYVQNINPYIHELENRRNDVESLLKYMNEHIKKRRSIVLFSAFKNYMYYIGMNDDDYEAELKRLKTPPANANSFNSKRFIQSKVLSREELKQIFNECSDDYKKLIFSFMYDTGCRRDELLSVKGRDILYKNFEKDKEDIENGIFAEVLIHGKGGKTRQLYLSRLTVNLLHKFPVESDERVFVLRKKNGEEYKVQSQALYVMIVKHGKSVLDRHIHPHCFRHTKMTHLADDGADILGIKAYAGHESVSTSQIYVEISSYIGKRVFKSFSKPIVDV